MKFLVLFLFVGIASASLYDALDDVAEDFVRELVGDVDYGTSYAAAEGGDNDIKTELGKKLQETLEALLEKVKVAIDHGKTVKEDLLNKVKEVTEKLKDLHIEVGGKAKELLKKLKDSAKEFLKKLLERLGLLDKEKEERSLHEDAFHVLPTLRELFRKLKQALLDAIDKDALKEKIETFFKESELAKQLLKILDENTLDKAKQKLLDFIDRILGNDSDRKERSLSELWEKVKDYFNNLQIEIKEKFLKFGKWAKDKIGKGIDGTKDRIENLKKMAKEFKDDIKNISKDVAVEGLEFFKQYKDDLGELYEQLKEDVKALFN